MSYGHLATRKSWSETRDDILEALRKWGIPREDVEFPLYRDAQQKVVLRFTLNRKWVVVECNRFPTPEQNLRALYAAIDDTRLAYQRGIGPIVATIATAFALPSGQRTPEEVLGVPAGTKDQAALREAYRKRAKETHPDVVGGNAEEFKRLQRAAEALGLA